MALAIGFPRQKGMDRSHLAVQRARMSVRRVKAREDEVRSVSDTMRRFFDEHNFDIRVTSKHTAS